MNKTWLREPSERPSFQSLVDDLSAEYEKVVASSSPPRDIGATLNSLLSNNVKRMSKRASLTRKNSKVGGTMSVLYSLAYRIADYRMRCWYCYGPL